MSLVQTTVQRCKYMYQPIIYTCHFITQVKLAVAFIDLPLRYHYSGGLELIHTA